MRVLDIELAGFQAFEHGLGSPFFLLGRECFFRSAERNEVLRLRLSGLVFDNVSGQIAEFTTDTVYTMQDAFFPVFEIGEDILSPYLSSSSGIFRPEVVKDADMVLYSVFVEPTEPFYRRTHGLLPDA